MPEFINVHCHLLNFKFVPDSFFKIRAPIREWMLRHKLTRWLARVITFLLPGKKYDKLHEVLALMKKDINDVAATLISEMKEAKIVLATPLMMDLELASFNVKPEIPYRYQVKLLSDIAAKYPGEIMPFIMFDPRRRSVSELIITALEEMGFLGVKMYPPLGYHPDPASFFNDAEVNHELEEIYRYCQDNSIPITTHCSKGGAYSGDLIRFKELALDFCQPSSWEGVLKKYPELYLNLAHFGGTNDFLKYDKPESWTDAIARLMKQYDHVYADISYHDTALNQKTSGRYFQILTKLMGDSLVKNRIMFGTDWLMTRHTWKEADYVAPFAELPPALLKQIAWENPLNFLFPARKLPPRINNFFQSQNISQASFPQWMKSNLQI